MGFELFTKGMQDANEILNRNFAAVETQLNGMSIQLYVSINGSDESGDGTQDKPYRTIQKAVDAIKPYHTDASIIIGAGDYDESVEIRNKTASIGLSRETRENSGTGTRRRVLRHAERQLQPEAAQCTCLYSGVSGGNSRRMRRHDP